MDADKLTIAEAFRMITTAALSINEVLSRRDDLNSSVPTNWPLSLSADEFAAECSAMADQYEDEGQRDDQIALMRRHWREMFKAGDRVRLVKDVDNYPTALIRACEIGTLTRIDEEGAYWIKLDMHHAALDEWENQLQLWDWSAVDHGDELPSFEDHPASYLVHEPMSDDDKHRFDIAG